MSVCDGVFSLQHYSLYFDAVDTADFFLNQYLI